MKKHFNLSSYSFRKAILLSGSLLAGTLGTATSAFAIAAPLITDGTYISGAVYDSGFPYSYATGGSNSINYTNGIMSQTNSASDASSPYSSATSTASLSSNKLNTSLSGSYGYTSGTAEMWDTLKFGNLPSGGTVNANTVIGTLNMTVTGSIGTAQYGVNTYASTGLSLYNTGAFSLQPGASFDCGYAGSSCGGLIGTSGLGPTILSTNTQIFSMPITQG